MRKEQMSSRQKAGCPCAVTGTLLLRILAAALGGVVITLLFENQLTAILNKISSGAASAGSDLASGAWDADLV